MGKQEVAVKVNRLTKSFRIPTEASNGIKQKVINLMKGVKGYRVFTPLNDISFEVRKGEFFGIVGRNGSGKSTLLKSIAEIYKPNSGSVSIDGKLVPFIELGVGFNPELTGRENVYLNGALLGFSHNEMEFMYDEIVEFAELSDFMEERLKNYSSGMQVRLAFSIAIKASGDILLLDEVLAVGDEAFQKKCNKFFADIKKDSSKTVILVTHDMSSVRRYCNKALMLENGKVVAFGDPEEVADDYSKQFINTATSIKESNQYGSGEVAYENITYTITNRFLTLDFDVVNKTNSNQSGITMGFDFCINDEIVIGNDTRFIDEYKRGIDLDAGEKRHYSVQFTNNFGNRSFTLNMNITTELGMNVTDHIRDVLAFDSTNIQFSDAWQILSFPTIKDIHIKK
jgi:ABC-type polysaccharide/polyol phosphate transport system ATPase subunit